MSEDVLKVAYLPRRAHRWALPQGWHEKISERLVCVRYRDDAEGQRKITTVEIVMEERPWHPAPKRIPDDTLLSLRVEYGEVEIGKAVRAAGGEWYPDQKVWKLPHKAIAALGLTDRIISEREEKT